MGSRNLGLSNTGREAHRLIKALLSNGDLSIFMQYSVRLAGGPGRLIYCGDRAVKRDQGLKAPEGGLQGSHRKSVSSSAQVSQPTRMVMFGDAVTRPVLRLEKVVFT